MKYDSVFDVLGHIIVGPSSSHTAGACRIGFIANRLMGGTPHKAQVFLHGSFAETYRGHKTDVAIIGGLLGFTPEDERIPFSFQLAKEQNLSYQIQIKDLGTDIHPNSVKILMERHQAGNIIEKLSIMGSSIGGGNIQITEIDGMQAGFDGDSPTLIETHRDMPGILVQIMQQISKHGYDIKEMHLSRNIRKKRALSWIELSKEISSELIRDLEEIPEIYMVRWLNV